MQVARALRAGDAAGHHIIHGPLAQAIRTGTELPMV